LANDIIRQVTNARRGRAVIFNNIVFLGGQVADDRAKDIRSQTEQILVKVETILEQTGSNKGRLLSVQIWLKDIAGDFAGMNEVWDAWIHPDEAPARATAQCEMGAPDALIEIIVSAAVSQ
jgi:enamine deaminase RidA (YjgF/YER057c/UK114 family)